MTTRSWVSSVPLATLGTLAILGVVSFVAAAAVIHEPIRSDSDQFPSSGAVLTLNASGARSLTTADVDAIARAVPDLVALTRVVQGAAPVAVGAQSSQVPIEGVDPSYPQVTGALVAPGTFFGPQDASAANPVAILGQSLAARLFASQSPIGQTIHIRNLPFTVIGVLENQGGATDTSVLIPFQTGQVRLFGPNSLDLVLLRVRDASQIGTVSAQVEQLLRQRHQIRAGQPDGFSVGADTPGPNAPAPEAAWQRLGHILQQYRQYVCEAKGLCSRAEPD